jgi:DtxR family Mn-dependent transcriptional regulator
MLTYDQYLAVASIYKTTKNKNFSLTKARLFLEKKYDKNIISQLASKDLVDKDKNSIRLTATGLEAALFTIRALAVLRFFYTEILALSQKEADRYIQATFFSLTPYLLEKYCTLIGHAHKGIPAGECCSRAKLQTSEQVVSLAQLPINTLSTIMYVKTATKTAMLKLFELGMYPGKTVRIHQLYPTYIVLLDQEEIALDLETAAAIFVKK